VGLPPPLVVLPPVLDEVVEPPMPVPELELELDVVVFPVLVEWVPVLLLVVPPPLPPPELHAPRLIPAAQPKNTPAVSHTFFMERPSEFLVAAP
jgi:hypothetical protein